MQRAAADNAAVFFRLGAEKAYSCMVYTRKACFAILLLKIP